jgi:hypothetical protein
VSGENPKAREAMDAVVQRQREGANEAGRPFDHKQATANARDAALRHDQRQDGIRKSPKP